MATAHDLRGHYGMPRRICISVVSLLVVVFAREAWSSSTECLTTMATQECENVDDLYEWPPTSSPTFTTQCYGCVAPLPIDASPCVARERDLGGLSLVVDGETVQGGRFEEAGVTCGDRGGLIRYVGPLVPGADHYIHYAPGFNRSPLGWAAYFKVADSSSGDGDETIDASSSAVGDEDAVSGPGGDGEAVGDEDAVSGPVRDAQAVDASSSAVRGEVAVSGLGGDGGAIDASSSAVGGERDRATDGSPGCGCRFGGKSSTPFALVLWIGVAISTLRRGRPTRR
jgi:hypothetical protein